jgi:hypothetical protein
MRVAYGWTKAVWMEIEVRGACSSGSRRGCVEGDERVVLYRDRIGVAYQAVLWKKKESETKRTIERYCSARATCGTRHGWVNPRQGVFGTRCMLGGSRGV